MKTIGILFFCLLLNVAKAQNAPEIKMNRTALLASTSVSEVISAVPAGCLVKTFTGSCKNDKGRLMGIGGANWADFITVFKDRSIKSIYVDLKSSECANKHEKTYKIIALD